MYGLDSAARGRFLDPQAFGGALALARRFGSVINAGRIDGPAGAIEPSCALAGVSRVDRLVTVVLWSKC